MAVDLFFVRHGIPEELEAEAGCPADPPLTPEGHEQASATAERLAERSIVRVFSSPMARARQTATPLARSLGLEPLVLEGLAEADHHAASSTYLRMETLRARPEVFAAFLSDPIRFLGADPDAFLGAVRGAVAEILAAVGEGRAAVFTHGLPINVVLSDMLGLDSLVRFAPAYCSVTRVRGTPEGLKQDISINDTGHLPRRRG
jgi:probable phosphoglycerate mutase